MIGQGHLICVEPSTMLDMSINSNVILYLENNQFNLNKTVLFADGGKQMYFHSMEHSVHKSSLSFCLDTLCHMLLEGWSKGDQY